MKIRMQSKKQYYIVIILCILFGLFNYFSKARAASDNNSVSEKIAGEIISKVPPLTDGFMGNKEGIKEYEKLISRGSQLIPGIVYILERADSENPMIISRVLNVAVEIKLKGVDVSSLLPLIRGLLKKEKLKTYVIPTLGGLGTKEDIPRLLSYLSDKEAVNRHFTAISLGYIADDEKTADEIEKILDTRIKNEIGLEPKKDITLKNGYMAANEIRIKAIKKKVIKEKDPKIKADLNSRIGDLEDEKKEWVKWEKGMDFPKHKHSQGQ